MTRLSVNINDCTAEALGEIAAAEGISYTEAVRRVGSGHAVYQAAKAGRAISFSGGGQPSEHLMVLTVDGEDGATPGCLTGWSQ